MGQTRLGWLVSILIGSIVVAGMVLAFRVSQLDRTEHTLQVVPAEAGRIYHERMQTMETLLRDERLEVSDRGGR